MQSTQKKKGKRTASLVKATWIFFFKKKILVWSILVSKVWKKIRPDMVWRVAVYSRVLVGEASCGISLPVHITTQYKLCLHYVLPTETTEVGLGGRIIKDGPGGEQDRGDAEDEDGTDDEDGTAEIRGAGGHKEIGGERMK
jgi:hypothetical protein